MRDVLGESWDILQTGVDWMSRGSHEGHPGTVLGHPANWGDLISTLFDEGRPRTVLGLDVTTTWHTCGYHLHTVRIVY